MALLPEHEVLLYAPNETIPSDQPSLNNDDSQYSSPTAFLHVFFSLLKISPHQN